MIVVHILAIATLIYFLAIFYLTYGVYKLRRFKQMADTTVNQFSIVIPFRNEADRIIPLLISLNELEYPRDKFEVILVDDDSTDSSVMVIEEHLQNSTLDWKIKPNKRKTASPKKDAITTAITSSRNDWIVTTDADCIIPNQWLKRIDSFIQKQDPVMVCGPVSFQASRLWSLSSQYQIVEGIALQGVSMGGFGHESPLLCNGANLAYKKEIFQQACGYTGNSEIASGDDIFLMESLRRKHPERIRFIKDRAVIVKTPVMKNWRDIIQQRIRWGSKTSRQRNWTAKGIAIIITVSNLILGIALLSLPFNWQSKDLIIQIGCSKIVLDLYFMAQTHLFLRQKLNFLMIIVLAVIYPFISSYIAIRSIFGGYTWKGREFRH
ncbi:MAG: glycosyltransferase [Flavobacteriaceae bacterium]|nr:glycosyltransferase [Flavobacteriaceae bacterium]NNK55220.1 glycosyltransferase [Flavobacteriaceae bacterium]